MSNCSMPRGALVPNCEVDNRLEHPRRWCTDLADGEYRALPLGVPDGLVGASECKTERGLDSSAGNVTIDEFRPFWICSAGRSLPPLEIRVDWEGWHGRDETWFANPGLVVTDQNGVDVTGKCTETRRVYTEVVKGTQLEHRWIYYQCTGVAPGTYTPRLTALPAGFTSRETCALQPVPVEPDLTSVRCAFVATSEPILDTPTTELPATGAPSRTLTAFAFAFLMTGLGMLATSRRRFNR